MFVYSVLLVILNYYIVFIEPARILAVFPMPSLSSQIFYRPLTQSLARRGHEVTIITTDPAFPKSQAPPNLREIDVHDLSYNLWKHEFNKTVSLTQLQKAFKVSSTVFKAQIMTKEVQDIIANENFDLLILLAIFPITLVFSQVFKVPVIQVSSLGGSGFNYKSIGASSYPLLYPSIFSKKSHNLTMYEIVEETWNNYLIEKYTHYTDEIDEIWPKMLRTDITPPTISELQNNVDMLFLNTYPFWTNNQPLPQNSVQIGGLHTMNIPLRKLSKDFQTFLDSSKNGVIYLSFGTNVKPSMVPPNKILMFLRVFSSLPYDVMWKWDLESLPEKSDNVKLFKWLPQAELLKHPKVKLFITQGGLQSTDEAISAGVPLIGIPMMSDQWFNVDNYVYHKIGVKLDLDSLTEQEFRHAIYTVITDESYRQNIVRLRTLMKDQPQSGLERAVWWTEYILRHKSGAHLRSTGANLTWTEYFEIELAFIIISIIIFIVILLYLLISWLWKIILKNLNVFGYSYII